STRALERRRDEARALPVSGERTGSLERRRGLELGDDRRRACRRRALGDQRRDDRIARGAAREVARAPHEPLARDRRLRLRPRSLLQPFGGGIGGGIGAMNPASTSPGSGIGGGIGGIGGGIGAMMPASSSGIGGGIGGSGGASKPASTGIGAGGASSSSP